MSLVETFSWNFMLNVIELIYSLSNLYEFITEVMFNMLQGQFKKGKKDCKSFFININSIKFKTIFVSDDISPLFHP